MRDLDNGDSCDGMLDATLSGAGKAWLLVVFILFVFSRRDELQGCYYDKQDYRFENKADGGCRR